MIGVIGWIAAVGVGGMAAMAGGTGEPRAGAPMAGGADGTIHAERVFCNGRIWTGDARRPGASAIAVLRGRIVAIGTDAEVRRWAGPQTEVVDLQGHRVVPGFYDAHLHFLGGGLQLSRVDLKDAADEEEWGKRLLAIDRNLPRERWLLGGNWDHDRTFGGQLPTAAVIDKYVKDRPVFLRRYDGHMGVANTAALRLAGITRDTADVAGGVIGRHPDGTPNGILRDNAMSLVERVIPEPEMEEVREAVLAALRHAARCGVTSVDDMDGSSPSTRRRYLQVLQELALQGRLTCRVHVRWPIALQKELADVGLRRNFGNDWVQLGGVKGFMDGSLGSSTAKMFEPYEAQPVNTGVFVTPPETMGRLIRNAHAAGLSVCVHAIGDQANAVLLDLYAAATPPRESGQARFRIEHAQHLRPADYHRFAALGVIASMQPYHVIDDGRWAEGRIGKKRCASSYAFRSLLDAGAILAFGSDWPVAPLEPLLGIDAAVNRRTLDGKHPQGWFPEQAITVTEAVKAYTWGSAYACFHEQDRGVLAAGYLADFVVLDHDIFDPAYRNSLDQANVVMTVVGGRTVYAAR